MVAGGWSMLCRFSSKNQWYLTIQVVILSASLHFISVCQLRLFVSPNAFHSFSLFFRFEERMSIVQFFNLLIHTSSYYEILSKLSKEQNDSIWYECRVFDFTVKKCTGCNLFYPKKFGTLKCINGPKKIDQISTGFYPTVFKHSNSMHFRDIEHFQFSVKI